MPHVTEHTPKVSTRSVKSYACESSREKRQQDRRTDGTDRHTGLTGTQTDYPKLLFSTFWGLYSTSQIRSYLEVDFLHDANTSIDMEVINKSKYMRFLIRTMYNSILFISKLISLQ